MNAGPGAGGEGGKERMSGAVPSVRCYRSATNLTRRDRT